MVNSKIILQARLMFLLILANFVAQVPYFFHLYYGRQPLAITARSLVVMGSVFAFFLAASYLLFWQRKGGYALMLAFLTAEFLFYLWGVFSAFIHGLGLFFQIHNPDLLLRIVYSVGYVNLFASGYFIFLLVRYSEAFRRTNSEFGSEPQK